METTISGLMDSILNHITLPYCLAVVFLSYALRNVLADFLTYIRFPKKHSKTFAVFVIATILAGVWLFGFGETDYVKLFVSYSVSTTIYELFLKHIKTPKIHNDGE